MTTKFYTSDYYTGKILLAVKKNVFLKNNLQFINVGKMHVMGVMHGHLRLYSQSIHALIYALIYSCTCAKERKLHYISYTRFTFEL